ncbi:ligand-binding sensor domain-containing protein [Flavobacterium aquicola]|uniref:histidine kinase n=1 Tax=Flavobacterium aquicola TaxID=1682742 RepID=A0A3E0EMD3_9FLAO|nr:sensor histidine kinase [Flavobacterium aquicola]REG98479.1 signal transduction histidine kinase [Flavobacterium aquicola]
MRKFLHKKKLFITILVFVVINTAVYPQTYCFRHYEVEAGISNNAVLCGTQDKLGFVWFGTRDGINRFDGYNFKIYRFPENNQIHSLHLNNSGTLITATERNIYEYSPVLDAFVLLVSPKKYPIYTAVSDNKENIWYNAGLVLSKYSKKNKSVKTYDFFQASALIVDKKGIIWAATSGGVLKKYDEATDSFKSFNLYSHSEKSVSRYASCIQSTSDGKILIGTNRGGVKIFDIKSETYKDIDLCGKKTTDLFIRCFLEVSPKVIWIGTETGIYSYNTETEISFKIEKNSADENAISDNVVYSLFKDKEGGVWVCTYFGGINYFPMQYTPFNKLYKQSSEKKLSGDIVREITKDPLGNLWIGTEDGGLNKLDANTKKMQYYQPDNTANSLSYICVHSLLSVENELWVGTFFHGLDIFNIRTGKVIRHYSDNPKKGFYSSFPFCMLKTESNELIVGAFPGLYKYNRATDYFSPIPNFPGNENYKCILKDSEGTLWAGIAGKGVMYHNEKTGKSGSFTFDLHDKNSISSDMVNSIFEDSRKNMWFATENGLCRFTGKKDKFIRYNVATGFPSNFILSILEDEKNNLWISTTKGLVCFDPAKNKVTTYTTANGLLSDQFNFCSAYKDKDNKMYFGSARGLISFNPSEFKVDSFVPPVYVTGLQINNKEIMAGQKGSPLLKSIIYAPKITLQYNQSTFSLDFSALGYTAPQALVYAYKLEGLSNKWTYVKSIRKANFTKLEKGIYVFKVKVASTAGIWNDKVTSITIEILPPWWLSIWAYMAYFVLGILLIYLILNYYHNRAQEKNRRKIEKLEIAREKEVMQIEIAKEKEMLEAKIEFYTQVAHEIRTPLTLIKIPLGKVIRKTEEIDEIKNSLKIMENNTDRLITLSNQLLDFRKTEIKAYSLSFEKADICELLNDAYQNFSVLADQAEIKLQLEIPEDPLFASVDVDAFTKILYNLLSNAVKYAETIVNIVLLPDQPDINHFTIQIKNDGYLIPDELREKIFEPFFRIKETETKTGSGIGLALARSIAQTHNGSLVLENKEQDKNIFSLTLPINNLEP